MKDDSSLLVFIFFNVCKYFGSFYYISKNKFMVKLYTILIFKLN